MPKCRVVSCYTKKLQRFGLCNKHRKWVEKGYMTQDLVMLKQPPKVGTYKNQICRIPDCEIRPRRNGMCDKHSSQHARGTLELSGERNHKRPLRYSKDATCKVHGCGLGGKIVRGFCRRHYKNWQTGIVDYAGYPLREKKRVPRYGEYDYCKVKGCSKRPRDSGFCHNHSQAWRSGVYASDGRRIKQVLVPNKGLPCQVEGCKYLSHAKRYCRTHYRRWRIGLRVVNEFVNKGKTCEHQGCTKPASCKGFCTTHYYRFMHDRPMDRHEEKIKLVGNAPSVK